MSGEKKKKKKAKTSKNGKNGENKKPAKQKKATRKTKSKGSRLNADIFTEAAMENAYITCHNVQDLLKWRGFPWPDAQKKKKGRRK